MNCDSSVRLRQLRGSRLSFVALALAMFLAIGASRMSAAEVVVRNDSINDGSSVAIQSGFDAGESAGVWLTSPCDGRIVAVQVFWKSLTGGQPPSLEQTIAIRSAGFFPNPGDVLALLEGPVMTDGFTNEFRYLDELNTIPIDVPINQGQTFAITFEFANDPNPLIGPSLVTDLDGCQPGRNAINAIGLGWVSACALGVSGDFFIRAVVDCDEPLGACCLTTGDCIPDAAESDCLDAGGTFQGSNSSCNGANCPVLIGGCCLPNGTCENNYTESNCKADGGAYLGDGVLCAGFTCPQPPQACCNPSGTFCAMQDPSDCLLFGGIPQGSGTTCTGPSQDQCPTGACCLPSGSCAASLTPAQCADQGGVYQGNGIGCGQVSCPQPQGACCLTSGGCTVSGQAVCEGFGHTWKGVGTNCSDANSNGTADACEPPDGDMNHSGETDGLDLQRFVDAMRLNSSDPMDVSRGDFNGNGVIDDGDMDGMVDALLGL